MQENAGSSSSVCKMCGEKLALVVTLTAADGAAQLLPDDPVLIQHPDSPGFMHKHCAMKWVDEQGNIPVQISFRLLPNSLRQGGDWVYFPPDTSVELVVDKDRDSFRLAFENESERGCVLVAAAFLDRVLEELLCKHFSNKLAGDQLVRGFNSPLGTFSSRITAALALGLLTESEHKQIDLVRRIRNEFAHTFANVKFSDSGIKSRVHLLPTHPISIGSAADPTRRSFETAVEVLLSNLRYRLDMWPKQENPLATLPCCYPCDDKGAIKFSGKVELGVELSDPWLISLGDRFKIS